MEWNMRKSAYICKTSCRTFYGDVGIIRVFTDGVNDGMCLFWGEMRLSKFLIL